MSAENVDKVRRIYEAFGTREWDTGFAMLDPDVEWHQVGPFPDSMDYCGKAEAKERLIDQFLMAFEDFDFDFDELVDSRRARGRDRNGSRTRRARAPRRDAVRAPVALSRRQGGLGVRLRGRVSPAATGSSVPAATVLLRP